MDLGEIQALVFEEYKKNGYLEEWTVKDELTQRKIDIAEIGLITTECAEAIEECRNEQLDGSLAYELADIVIRTLNFATRKQINLEAFILEKHKRNMRRDKLHGRKI